MRIDYAPLKVKFFLNQPGGIFQVAHGKFKSEEFTIKIKKIKAHSGIWILHRLH